MLAAVPFLMTVMVPLPSEIRPEMTPVVPELVAVPN